MKKYINIIKETKLLFADNMICHLGKPKGIHENTLALIRVPSSLVGTKLT